MMKDLQTIKVAGPDGKDVEIKVITVLQKPNEDKKFLLYTFDAEKENVDIYASVINDDNGAYVLDSITDKDDWELIQKAIAELSE
ncbi:MAG: DUF1292 domain-containing protein [Bacilli bacterium]|nr:DUF1292 domain-containing protein [Bacilli bacterium]